MTPSPTCAATAATPRATCTDAASRSASTTTIRSEELEEIADRAKALDSEAEQVHVMFNNNARELAPKAARALRGILGQDPGPEP